MLEKSDTIFTTKKLSLLNNITLNNPNAFSISTRFNPLPVIKVHRHPSDVIEADGVRLTMSSEVQVHTTSTLNELPGAVVMFEGNMCSGKSTLIRGLRDMCSPGSCEAVLEEVNPDLLAAAYENPEKYGLALQLCMFTLRLSQLRGACLAPRSADKLTLIDRGLWGDGVFAETCLAPDDYKIYKSVVRDRCSDQAPQPTGDLFVYLDVSPEECMRRIHCERKTPAESSVALAYLEKLDAVHFEHLLGMLSLGMPDRPPRALILSGDTYVSPSDVATRIVRTLGQPCAGPVVILDDRPEHERPHDCVSLQWDAEHTRKYRAEVYSILAQGQSVHLRGFSASQTRARARRRLE